MKVKRTIRSIYDKMKKELPKELIKAGERRSKEILDEMKAYKFELVAGGDTTH
jgi:hypothetical protein